MVLFAYVGHIETSVLDIHTFKETWKRSCGCFSLEHPATYHAAVIHPCSGDAALTCSCDLNQAVAFRKTPRSHGDASKPQIEVHRLPWRPPPLSSCSSRRTPADPEQLTSAISRRRRARGCLPESRIHGNRQAREDGGALMGGWGGCETSAKQHTSPLTLLTNAHTHKYTHTHTLRPVLWRAEATANTHTHTHTPEKTLESLHSEDYCSCAVSPA